MTDLERYADKLLRDSRAIHGSGTGYAADAARVVDALESNGDQSDALTASAMQGTLRNQTAAISAVLEKNFAALQQEIRALRRDMGAALA